MKVPRHFIKRSLRATRKIDLERRDGKHERLHRQLRFRETAFAERDEAHMSERYELISTDLNVLEAVKFLLRKLAEPGVVRPDQLISIAKLLHVASRAPRVCRSVDASVSISIRDKKEEYRGMSCWQFSAFDGHLRVQTGGSEYDPTVGSDSFSTMEWSIHPSQKAEWNGVWDESWMVPELQYHPEQKLNIDLRSSDYEISVEDHANELLGDYGQEEDEAS
jgi:hypothetical protein